jgi:hypothetical protein
MKRGGRRRESGDGDGYGYGTGEVWTTPSFENRWYHLVGEASSTENFLTLDIITRSQIRKAICHRHQPPDSTKNKT